MKKIIKKTLPLILVLSIISTAQIITPKSITLSKNSYYSAYPNGFIKLVSARADADSVNTENVGKSTLSAKLFGYLPVKSVEVSVLPEKSVIPSGKPIGIRLYSDGVMVVDIVSGEPADLSGIKKGDIIAAVNSTPCRTLEDLASQLAKNSSNTLSVCSDGENKTVTLNGKKTDFGYTVGMWVRDSAAGIGTMTFYNQETQVFGALGHPICDVDTKNTVLVSDGSIADCNIFSAKCGKRGEPGELIGTIAKNHIGTVLANNQFGIFGIADVQDGTPIPVATKFMVKEASAQILCDVGDGTRPYDIYIEHVSPQKSDSNKAMVIKITDEALISKTGGIVQGMSGAPIVQDGRFVGAVTHVFVDDPTKGYAIFAETMLDFTENNPVFDKT